MSHNILLVPIGARVGLSSVSLGLLRALERLNLQVQFFKPISQVDPSVQSVDSSIAYLLKHGHNKPVLPLSLTYSEHLVSQAHLSQLLEEIVERFSTIDVSSSVNIIEGLVVTEQTPWANRINIEIARTLQADIVFVAAPCGSSAHELQETVEIFYNNFGGSQNEHLLGVVVNKIGVPQHSVSKPRDRQKPLAPMENQSSNTRQFQLRIDECFKTSPVPLLASVAWNPELSSPRVRDVAHGIGATFIHSGDSELRRLKVLTLCDHSVSRVLDSIIPGALLMTTADRVDVIVAVCLAAKSGVEVGALLFTGGQIPSDHVLSFCRPALQTGLPLLLTEDDSLEAINKLQNLDFDFPVDDAQQANAIQDFVAECFSESWLESLTKNKTVKKLLSPAAFRFQLTQMAQKCKKTIILPEGDEPRTLRAAHLCAERKIANVKLVGEPENMLNALKSLGLSLIDGMTIVNPSEHVDRLIPLLVALRQHKGMTEPVAKEQLKDNVMLATLMLQQGEVDGLVSGAVHTTANTIRPALQIIRTAPESTLVSSIFFMLLPDQVLVYGDCAINPDPSAEELSEIAIQSAMSAQAFGIEPKVALISYSTGTSGEGVDVNKVREATALTRKKRPDLIVDGPLQYDAAITEAIAKSKAPSSPVAGQANVLIFPDLNTGNTTYKAVQRSAGLLSIGPMLQGLNKPVNDLSRGASVEDIVYTIALTAIQAAQTL